MPKGAAKRARTEQLALAHFRVLDFMVEDATLPYSATNAHLALVELLAIESTHALIIIPRHRQAWLIPAAMLHHFYLDEWAIGFSDDRPFAYAPSASIDDQLLT